MGKPEHVEKLPSNPVLNRNYKIRKGSRSVTFRANRVKKDSPFYGKMKWKWSIIKNKRYKSS